ncbi:hypothetical protein NFD58_12605 [Staphylococcus epidermidis]|nr:hypothetical protein [Staphylococcus epidermidis]
MVVKYCLRSVDRWFYRNDLIISAARSSAVFRSLRARLPHEDIDTVVIEDG